ncbi:MAG: iron complex outermembrane receptor protein, partial [Pseudoalteromonas rhizosphaerae]
MLNNKISKAVRLAIAFGAASTAAFSATSFAAEEEGVDKVERIQVTGSRIKRTDLESASPVLVLDRSDIAASGQISIGNILQQIPAAGAALNTAFNNGGNGATNMDLRNLGAQRLLVLVNGKRWISSLGSTVDLNTIPAASIERVEVVKDGASAIYGSDAIAGVVNIITRKDFEGAELSVYGGENLKYNDGRQYSADLTIGTTSDKGGLMMNLSHVTQAEIWAGDRDISSMGN